jgi:succinoglycan biosynthesis protein ExoA
MSLIALGTPIVHAAAIPIASWAAVCLVYGLYLALKGRDLGTLAAGAAAMTMHMGYSIGFWRAVVGQLWAYGSDGKKP